MANWLLIQGSPRVNGTSAKVIRMITMFLEQKCSDINLMEFDIARRDVSGCNGCEYCKTADECIIEDDMFDLDDMLEKADRVILATPIYFAGLSSQMKAIVDRLQPYYWDYVQRKESGKSLREKRPLTLYVIGDGGDPHGYEPLLISLKSGFALAGFSVDNVIDLVGKQRISAGDLQMQYFLDASL